MYSVYLDSVLITDPVGGIDDFVLTLERTFDTDNLFREFTETTLTFTGEAFNYLCQVLQSEYCAKVPIIVEINGEQIFEGQIIVSFGTINFTKRTFETQIVDTSYRGLIRERIKNEINLNSILTVGCEPLTPLPVLTLPMYDVNNNFVTNIQAYKVYDVFTFLIASISDNQVAFQSNFLQTIPYAITTGWNISQKDNALPFRLYPTISFEKIYSIFRSLLTLYGSIEIIAGQPTLILEPESYFFQNTSSSYQIAELPHDTTIEVDEERIYSVVRIGTSEYDDESTNNAFPNLKVNGWGERTLNTCGCVFDKDNVEDYTVDWIIDSGKILDTLSDQDGQDDIYIIQLDPLTGNTPLFLENSANGKYYYNSSLRNEIVALLWSVLFNNCVYSTRTSDNSFRSIASPPDPPYPSPLPDDIQFIEAGPCNLTPFSTSLWMFYPQLQYDTYGGVQTINNNQPCNGGVLDRHTVYECQNFGQFAFTASRTVDTLYSFPNTFTIDFGLAISISVYQDNTFGTIIHTSTTIDSFTASSTNFFTGFTKTLTVNTPILNLEPGNVARVSFLVSALPDAPLSTNITTVFLSGIFESNDELLACSDIREEGNRIPYLMKFEHPICKSDYNLINANRRNYVEVAGNKGWVKRLDYNPKGIGTFELLLEEFNSCCNE